MASSLTSIFPIFSVASCCYAGLAYAIVSVQFDSTNVPESPCEVVPSFHETTENLATSCSPGMWSDSLWRGMRTVSVRSKRFLSFAVIENRSR